MNKRDMVGNVATLRALISAAERAQKHTEANLKKWKQELCETEGLFFTGNLHVQINGVVVGWLRGGEYPAYRDRPRIDKPTEADVLEELGYRLDQIPTLRAHFSTIQKIV